MQSWVSREGDINVRGSREGEYDQNRMYKTFMELIKIFLLSFIENRLFSCNIF